MLLWLDIILESYHFFYSCYWTSNNGKEFNISIYVLNYLMACWSGSYPTNQILPIYCLILKYNSLSLSKCNPHPNCLNTATAPSTELYLIVKSSPTTSLSILNRLLCWCPIFSNKYILRVTNNFCNDCLIFNKSYSFGWTVSIICIDIVFVFILSCFYLLNCDNTAHYYVYFIFNLLLALYDDFVVACLDFLNVSYSK